MTLRCAFIEQNNIVVSYIILISYHILDTYLIDWYLGILNSVYFKSKGFVELSFNEKVTLHIIQKHKYILFCSPGSDFSSFKNSLYIFRQNKINKIYAFVYYYCLTCNTCKNETTVCFYSQNLKCDLNNLQYLTGASYPY